MHAQPESGPLRLRETNPISSLEGATELQKSCGGAAISRGNTFGWTLFAILASNNEVQSVVLPARENEMAHVVYYCPPAGKRSTREDIKTIISKLKSTKYFLKSFATNASFEISTSCNVFWVTSSLNSHHNHTYCKNISESKPAYSFIVQKMKRCINSNTSVFWISSVM